MRDQAGGCLCGAVRFVLKAEPQAVVICHCTHCRKQSGSAFSINLLMREDDVEVSGETRFFVDHGDSGLPSYRHFCPNCGSPLMTRAENLPGVAIVKAGALDDPASVRPQAEIYTDHALGWFTPVAGAARYEQAPPPAR
ncbi:aldehyde-activating protein [Pseudomonas sp. ADP]|nr:aldehyde-activating protein [Pseudomonas sp. ADP]OBP09802.1 aldehyde-activating protein [Pseudomonas sp. EGD-AKN5]QOF83767.1 GFA family protein [Pseudomonas sp. ADPe]